MDYDSAGIDDDADEPLFVAPPPHVDPFEQCKPPKGKVYQWVTTHVMGEAVHPAELKRFTDAGWKYVPKKRHPEFPSDNRLSILWNGQVLMEMTAKRWEKLHGRDREWAMSLDKGYREALDMERPHRGYGAVNHIFPASFVISEPYQGVGPNAIDVSVEITVRMPARLRDAAAFMHLTPQEYMRRRLIMYSHRNSLHGLLLPLTNTSGFGDHEMVPLEFIEDANLKVERAR